MMARKLHDNRGETLVEMLASILIAALAVALLFTCCMASVEMGRETWEADKNYYEALSKAEEQKAPLMTDADGNPLTAVVKVESSSVSETVEINLYGGEEMYSYQWKGAAPGDP